MQKPLMQNGQFPSPQRNTNKIPTHNHTNDQPTHPSQQAPLQY